MNNSVLKLFHELMKKGWIDRNDNSLMWNLVEDNEARDELDQMGIELGFEIIQAQDRIYMVPTQDNDLFLKNNVDYRADIKATNEVRSRDLYLMNYLAIYILFIFFKGEGVDALTRDFITKEELIKEFTKHCQDVTRDDIDKDDKECTDLIQKVDKWLDSFCELREMISEEQDKYKAEQDLYMAKSAAEADYKAACDAVEMHVKEMASLQERMESIEVLIRDINSILENVDNAKSSEVLEGDYSTLFAQYKALLSNMDESLAGLRSTLESEQNSKQRYEEELAGYSCEESEYADPTLSVEILSKVRQERETYEKTRDSRQDEYTDKKGDYIAAEQEVKHAQEALAEHEGIPLPQEEIGEAFKERLSKAREEIKRLRSRLNILENEKRSLEKISYQVNSELEGYSEGIVAEGTILSANPDEQWKTLKAKLIFSKTEYTRKREELYRKIQTTVTTYKDIALAEIVLLLGNINFRV